MCSSGFRFQYPRHFVGGGGGSVFLEIAPAVALGFLLLNVHKPLHTVLFRGGLRGFCGLYASFPTAGVFVGYGRGLFCGSGGVLLQNGKDSGAVKVVAQFFGR